MCLEEKGQKAGIGLRGRREGCWPQFIIFFNNIKAFKDFGKSCLLTFPLPLSMLPCSSPIKPLPHLWSVLGICPFCREKEHQSLRERAGESQGFPV